MKQEQIDRINALSKLARQRELTAEEQAERLVLRRAYADGFKQSLEAQLQNIKFVDEKGKQI